jgi:hypothetical protein
MRSRPDKLRINGAQRNGGTIKNRVPALTRRCFVLPRYNESFVFCMSDRLFKALHLLCDNDASGSDHFTRGLSGENWTRSFSRRVVKPLLLRPRSIHLCKEPLAWWKW